MLRMALYKQLHRITNLADRRQKISWTTEIFLSICRLNAKYNDVPALGDAAYSISGPSNGLTHDFLVVALTTQTKTTKRTTPILKIAKNWAFHCNCECTKHFTTPGGSAPLAHACGRLWARLAATRKRSITKCGWSVMLTARLVSMLIPNGDEDVIQH